MLRTREHRGKMKFIEGDVRNFKEINRAAKETDAIFHTAAQVAVTTSIQEPRLDFEINGLGTLNVLEAARRAPTDPIVIYTSTNKVYGDFGQTEIIEESTRYRYKHLDHGINELMPVDPCTPYGISKYVGDDYASDYAKTYGLASVVFRQSCIYGPWQHGSVDQGWLAYLAVKMLVESHVTIYGNGKQVRDVLYVDDLANLFEKSLMFARKNKGEVYNVGGGPDNTFSLLEYVAFLEKITNKKIDISFEEWRPRDQKVYVSDIRKVKRNFNWSPRTGIQEGVKKMLNWIKSNPALFLRNNTRKRI
jgi:CDP-paratose 2-epimerase